MLTYEDCVGLGHFTAEELDAIAEHEHAPDIIAVEIAEYLIQDADGVRKIRRIILDDISAALDRGHTDRADKLRMVLAHFIATHPERA